jgi:hypothetical protein
VVWQGITVDGDPYKIYGQRLSSSGALSGSNFAIGYTGSEENQYHPNVAYNPNESEYLVVWHDDRDSGSLYAQRVSSSGALLGSNFIVSSSEIAMKTPSIVFNAVDNQYLVVWEKWRPSSEDIYAQRVSRTGTLVGTEIVIRSGSAASLNPSVNYNPQCNEYFITWDENGNILGQVISSTGTKKGIIQTICNATNTQSYPSNVYNSVSNRYFMSWQDVRNGNYDIYGASTPPQLCNQSPGAVFTFSPSVPSVGEQVLFNASESIDLDGLIVRYEWDFGDGNLSNTTAATITHSYSKEGNYTVNLTVTDDNNASDKINKPLRVIATNDTIPPSITFVPPTPANNSEVTVSYVFINVTTNEPCNTALLNWNGTNETMNGSGTNFYLNRTGLSNGLYGYKVYVNDTANNWNVSETRVVTVNVPVPPDTTPPSSVTNLMNITGQTWINWTWTNPADPDFDHIMVYVDGTWQMNTSTEWYNATGLNPDTYYDISTHTVDTVGNVNTTWVNRTTKTLAIPDTTPPASITNLQNVSGQTGINWSWTNPLDTDFDYTMVYMDGVWQTNTSDPSYNATGLDPDTSYEIGTHTVDTVGNINTAWVNQTTKTLQLPAENSLSIPDLTVLQARNTTASITLKNSTGVASVGMKLSYNASVVNATGAIVGDFTAFFGFDDSNAANGWITINTYILGQDLTGDVKVADVTLEAVGTRGDTSPLNLEILSMATQYGSDVTGTTDNGTLTIPMDSSPPLVTNPASSQAIPDDTDNDPQWGEIATLNVTVTDDTEVASVTVNLSAIGGSAIQPMSNVAGNTWSVTTNASAGTPPQTYYLQVNATDIYGNSNISVSIPLTVLQNGDITGNDLLNIADAMLLANNVSYPYHDPPYVISSPHAADVTGNGLVNIADAMLLANNVSYPYHNPPYVLR